MFYLWLKLIHILSSTILFGTGIGTAAVMVYGYYFANDIKILTSIHRYVVIADWVFTLTSAILQPLTGISLVLLAGYSFHNFWISGSIIGYFIAGCCWIPVVFLQIKMRDLAITAEQKKMALPNQYHHYFKIWFLLGWPAFISLLLVFYLMTFKPV